MPQVPTRHWSLLSYISVDNDLSILGKEDVNEMCQVGATTDSHIAVQLDTRGNSGVQRIEISKKDFTGKAYRQVLENLDETASGQSKVLRSFLNWGINRCHAKNRILVLGGHGSGFKTLERDVLREELGTGLRIADLALTLAQEGLDKPDHKLGILGFDACLMNLLEIAHKLVPFANYMIASQAREPGNGWPYNVVLQALGEKLTPANLSDKIVKGYADYYLNLGKSNITLSVIDLQKVTDVMHALDELGASLIHEDPSVIQSIKKQTPAYTYEDHVDIVSFCSLVQQNLRLAPQTRKTARELSSAASLAVTSNHTEGREVQGSHGLSFWFPTKPSVYDHVSRNRYKALVDPFTQWLEYLDFFHKE